MILKHVLNVLKHSKRYRRGIIYQSGVKFFKCMILRMIPPITTLSNESPSVLWTLKISKSNLGKSRTSCKNMPTSSFHEMNPCTIEKNCPPNKNLIPMTCPLAIINHIGNMNHLHPYFHVKAHH